MAEQALQELLGARPAVRAKNAGATFGDAVDIYLARAKRDREPSTYRGYKGIVGTHLEPRIGRATPLASITTATVDAFREAMLDAGKAPRTVQQAQVVLHGVLGRAVRDGLLEANPAARAEKVRVRASGAFNVLEPAEVEAVGRAAAGAWAPVDGDQHASDQCRAWADQTAATIRFAAYTGLRLGELRALRWEDVDFAHAIVHVRRNAPTSAPAGASEKPPKSGLVRSVPLIDQAARALDAISRREFFLEPGDRVFPAQMGGPFNDNDLRRAFYAALDGAGLGHLRTKENPIRLHDLRHCFGSLAVRVAPLSDVRLWMGHSDIATTMRYVHSVPRNDVAAKLSAAFSIEVAPAGELMM
ncbi:tyrosine-type recombinase/integrase [Baekduia soli]|nr:site-specific integrase [Baekduia soli]